MQEKSVVSSTSGAQLSRMHRAIRGVTENVESFKYNLALIQIMDYANYLLEQESVGREAVETLLKLLSPFTPHTCEELWEQLGNKGFISLEGWPKHDEGLIDEKTDYYDKYIDNLRADVNDVLKLINVSKPGSIKIIISQDWKYEFVKEFKHAFSESKDLKVISQKLLLGNLKRQGPEVMRLLPGLLKDQSKVPEVILSAEEEINLLESNKCKLEKHFGCKVLLEKADSSSEQKARNAWPGKPAIIVS